MKHAFLIIAHHNWWQLKELIKLLDAENHDIYIHIDKKSGNFPKEELEKACRYSRVFVFQEYKVYWGGFVQVQTELFLFEKAYDEHYDYYHMLSGDDLPLKSNKEIDQFFEENQGKQFIAYDDNALRNNPEISRRTKYYHFLQNYRRRYQRQWINGLFTFLERVSLVMQIMCGVNRVKNLDWEIKYGSNWVSISDDLVQVIIEQKEKIESIFKYTNCADELFIQTIAANFGFEDQVYHGTEGQNANVRYIDWKRGSNGNPYTFKVNDYELLIGEQNTNMFARKFSESNDIQIICKIIDHLKKKGD